MPLLTLLKLAISTELQRERKMQIRQWRAFFESSMLAGFHATLAFAEQHEREVIHGLKRQGIDNVERVAAKAKS